MESPPSMCNDRAAADVKAAIALAQARNSAPGIGAMGCAPDEYLQLFIQDLPLGPGVRHNGVQLSGGQVGLFDWHVATTDETTLAGSIAVWLENSQYPHVLPLIFVWGNPDGSCCGYYSGGAMPCEAKAPMGSPQDWFNSHSETLTLPNLAFLARR